MTTRKSDSTFSFCTRNSCRLSAQNRKWRRRSRGRARRRARFLRRDDTHMESEQRPKEDHEDANNLTSGAISAKRFPTSLPFLPSAGAVPHGCPPVSVPSQNKLVVAARQHNERKLCPSKQAENRF